MGVQLFFLQVNCFFFFFSKILLPENKIFAFFVFLVVFLRPKPKIRRNLLLQLRVAAQKRAAWVGGGANFNDPLGSECVFKRAQGRLVSRFAHFAHFKSAKKAQKTTKKPYVPTSCKNTRLGDRSFWWFLKTTKKLLFFAKKQRFWGVFSVFFFEKTSATI